MLNGNKESCQAGVQYLPSTTETNWGVRSAVRVLTSALARKGPNRASEKGVKAASGEVLGAGRGPIGVGVGSEEQPTKAVSRMSTMKSAINLLIRVPRSKNVCSSESTLKYWTHIKGRNSYDILARGLRQGPRAEPAAYS
jgi:hypothetical protein